MIGVARRTVVLVIPLLVAIAGGAFVYLAFFDRLDDAHLLPQTEDSLVAWRNAIYVLAYLGIGIAVYFGFRRLFRRAGFDTKILNGIWESWLRCGDPFLLIQIPLFWPLMALITMLELSHVKAKRRNALAREESSKRDNPYSHLSMDQLLAAQRKLLKEGHIGIEGPRSDRKP